MNRARPGTAFLSAVTLSIAFLAAVAGLSGCKTTVPKGGRVKVAASIVPLGDFCANVGGDLVEVEVLVPPMTTPGTYEPTSEQKEFLSEARVFVVNGLGLEPWAAEVTGEIGNEELRTVVAGDAIPRQRLLKAEQPGEGPYDPYVWLEPGLATYEVNAIRDALIEVDPANKDTYAQNAGEYTERLATLDRRIHATTGTFSQKKFVALPPIWGYFAAHYGLVQVEVFHPVPGTEPSAEQIAGLVETMKSNGIKVVFTEPQFSPRTAQVIVHEAGQGAVVKMLDPIGNPDKPDVSTYIKMMNHDVDVLEASMK